MYILAKLGENMVLKPCFKQAPIQKVPWGGGGSIVSGPLLIEPLLLVLLLARKSFVSIILK